LAEGTPLLFSDLSYHPRELRREVFTPFRIHTDLQTHMVKIAPIYRCYPVT
jgi:hypothetical protein